MKNKTKKADKKRGLELKKQVNATLMTLPMYLFTIAFVLGPLVYMVVLSFMSRDDGIGVAAAFTFDNYKNIFLPVYLATFTESLKLGFITTICVTLIGYPYAYFMVRAREKMRKRLLMMQMIPFWVNSLTRLYGWVIIFRANGLLDKLLMTLKITSEPLQLLYTYPVVVVGMIYVLLPYMIFSVHGSLEKLDWALVESARDLGASPARAFWDVTFKLSLPGLLTGVILTFIPSMGLFFIADILGGNKIVLVGNLIQEQLMKAHNQPFAAALSVVLMAVTSLFILLYRRVAKVDKLEIDNED